MAEIRPLNGVRFSDQLSSRLSDLVAPPYDVLDEAGKAALQARHPNNIVTIDLPHLPPKSVGPDATYQAADRVMKDWLARGILVKDSQPAIYAYAQTYAHGQRTYHRRGFFARVRLSPFGQGEVVPHEKTYPQAITDRLKLTQATHAQLSPVFGLYSDPENQVTGKLFAGLGQPKHSALLDNVRNDLWVVTDPQVQEQVSQLMAPKSIYIADGHHRYTMALQYQKELDPPADHPANYALFVLVAMQDPGLLILPTHRIIGGLNSFDPKVFAHRLADNGTMTEISTSVCEYAQNVLPQRPRHTFGLFDGATRKLYEIKLTQPDILATREPSHSIEWRKLEVAIVQRYFLDEIISPAFAGGGEPIKSYTADPNAIVGMTDGKTRQIAILLQSTPLCALEALGRHKEVMPQKSTYFFPKLATGMIINPLD